MEGRNKTKAWPRFRVRRQGYSKQAIGHNEYGQTIVNHTRPVSLYRWVAMFPAKQLPLNLRREAIEIGRLNLNRRSRVLLCQRFRTGGNTAKLPQGEGGHPYPNQHDQHEKGNG